MVLFVFFWLISAVEANDESTSVRLFNYDRYLLNLDMDVLTDPSGELTIKQVSAPGNAVGFKRNTQKILNLGISSNAHWVRFRLSYPDSYPNKAKEKQWYLEVARSHCKH